MGIPSSGDSVQWGFRVVILSERSLYNIEENLIVITNGSSSIALYHVYYDPVLAASQYLFLKSGTICRLIKTIQ